MSWYGCSSGAPTRPTRTAFVFAMTPGSSGGSSSTSAPCANRAAAVTRSPPRQQHDERDEDVEQVRVDAAPLDPPEPAKAAADAPRRGQDHAVEHEVGHRAVERR